MIQATQRYPSTSDVIEGTSQFVEGYLPAPESSNKKWPVWKTLAFIIIFCGLSWTAIIFGILWLMGF